MKQFFHSSNDTTAPFQCLRNYKIYAHRYRFDVLILDVLYTVTNLVHRVWRAAPGPANTRGDAKCPAQRPAIVCHVTNVALRPSRVAIDVQEFVVKCVRRGIATNVPINTRLESTFSR
jgi:hypothetical protein